MKFKCHVISEISNMFSVELHFKSLTYAVSNLQMEHLLMKSPWKNSPDTENIIGCQGKKIFF